MDVNVDPLVNKASNFFRLKKRAERVAIKQELTVFKPFITVAREPGSGGAPIAKAIAQKLGYALIDEQLVEDIARSTRRRKEVIKSLDEKSRSSIEELIDSILNPEYVGEGQYISELFRTILAYALEGEVVIIGRGANFITPFARGLHVNITAPYETRVHRAMVYEGHTREKAKEVIASVEKERNDFVKKYISKDVRKFYAYDLILNTQSYRIDEARDIIVEAFYQKFAKTFGITRPKS